MNFFKREFNITFLPNVREYKCVVGNWDKDFERIGVKRRSWRRAEIQGYKNRKYNKFLVNLLKRIWKDRHETGKYSLRRAKRINALLRSRAAFIMALQHVEPHWYSKPKYIIDRCFKKHLKIGNIFNLREFETKRVYIPKGLTKWRPLGVPKLWERTSLHLLTKVMMFIIWERIPLTQHGITTRGTKTAWREVLTKGIRWTNIFEYDLRGFFDNVNYFNATMQLDTEYWDSVKNSCKFVTKHLGFENDLQNLVKKFYQEFYEMRYYMDNSHLGPLIVAMKEEASLLRKRMKEPLIAYILRINKSKPVFKKPVDTKLMEGDIVRIREELFGAFKGSKGTGSPEETKGVPQGGPHSPLLAMLGKTISDLHDPYVNHNVENHIEYVDDGIADRAIVGNEASGSDIQYAKTGWVKREGKWIKPLKFLGLTYDGEKDLLYASTRNGATLKLEGPVLEVVKNKLNIKETDWDVITKSKYWGWIMSRLYQDTWIESKYLRRQWIVHGSKSWLETVQDIMTEKIHTQSINRYLIDVCKWWDPRDGTQITETNKSSICCNMFMEREYWENISVDRRNEYRRIYGAAVRSGNRVNPIIIKGKEIYDGERLYKGWKQYKKGLRKGVPLSCRMLDLFTMHTSKGEKSWIYNTVKIEGWSQRDPLIYDTRKCSKRSKAWATFKKNC